MLVGALRDKITYWALSAMDGYGERAFAAPVLFKGRWEDRTDLLVGPVQEQKPSKAVAWLPQPVVLGGYLARGDYAEETIVVDPTTLANAYMIMRYDEIPAITGTEVLKKAVM